MNTFIIKAQKPVKDFYEIIIPSAGIGRRMKTYGPKALISINDHTTIIQNQLQIIDSVFNNYRIILVCGFQADKLMSSTPDHLIKIENENFVNTNVVRSIGMGLRATLGSNVIILYGDLVFNSFALQYKFDESCLVLDSSGTMPAEEVGCIVTNNQVESLCYDLPQKWGQIAYLTGKELALLKKVCWNRENDRMFGFEAFNMVINLGGRFKGILLPKAKIIDIDTSKNIETARTII